MSELIIGHMKYIALFLGFAAGVPIVWYRQKDLWQSRFLQIAVICVCFSVFSTVSAMIFAGIESVIAGNGFQLGAVSTYGVYLICPFLILIFAKVCKKDVRSLFDAFALYAMPSLFFLRVNCFMTGCCGGKEIFGTGMYWPTRQAEMLFYTIVLIFLIYREKKGAVKGTGFPLLMILYGSFRFIEEWFRTASGAGFIHLAHIWSLITIVIGACIYFELGAQKGAHRGGKYV